MGDVLAELRERRAYECRLTPDRALGSLAEAGDFLRDRGMLTRTADSSLPSLYEACHEEPYQAGGRGFASWPATKWWWAGELAQQPGVHALKIHRGKILMLTDETLRLVDPICRSEVDRMATADPGWARLLRYLRDAGPSLVEDVQTELGLKPKELRALRAPLERCGALVSRQVVLPAAGARLAGQPAPHRDEHDGGEPDYPHVHTAELARWDQAYPTPAVSPGGLGDLLAAAVRAAVLAPERELIRWFSWRWLFTPDLIDRLADDGQLVRPAAGYVAAPDEEG